MLSVIVVVVTGLCGVVVVVCLAGSSVGCRCGSELGLALVLGLVLE